MATTDRCAAAEPEARGAGRLPAKAEAKAEETSAAEFVLLGMLVAAIAVTFAVVAALLQPVIP